MFCENCGNKLKKDHKFCTKCGHSNTDDSEKRNERVFTYDKWWHRLLKVLYTVVYLLVFIITPLVWFENIYYSYSDAFWLSFVTFVVYLVSLRLIKITILYVFINKKPQWKKEFKKLF